MTEIAHISQRVTEFCEATQVPGFLAGIYHAGEQAVVVHGVANTATGAPMREDTGFLFGSITKIMTTTLVLQQVERGTLDLDVPVVEYLPEFRLPVPGAAEKIRVRHLVTHTSGIDADLFFPDAVGPDALKVYVERLGRECGTLFEPGEYVSYSNGGMMVAGRLLEVVTGQPYHELLERDVFTAAGMADACTSAERAILRSTAIGHFADPATGSVRPTGMFMLPPTWGPAGATPIGTIADLLAFGRIHLDDGLAPSGTRVLSAESVQRMRTVTHDLGTPNTSPVGIGWLLQNLGGTTVLTMSGASPGGVAVLAVMPEHDLGFAAYGNDARSLALHDELLLWLAGRFGTVQTPVYTPQEINLQPYVGTYRSNQLRIDVSIVDGSLEERVVYEPADESQEQIFTSFVGGSFTAPPLRYVPVGKDLFAPAGVPPPRDSSGYRRYGAEHAILLVKIRTLVEAGVPLARVKGLLAAGPEQLAAAVDEIDRNLRKRAEEIRRTRQRIAQLQGGDRLFVSAEVATYLERLREIGISERSVLLERELWILLQSVAPEQAAAWVADKLAAIADPEFCALYLDYDAAFDWSPDDPRLPAIAERTRKWYAGRDTGVEDGPPPDPAITRLATVTANAASPAWARIAEMTKQAFTEPHPRPGMFE